jgi:hypothetical protein
MLTPAELIARYRHWWKAEWAELLFNEPKVSALGDPVIMVHGMEATITAFLESLSQPASGPSPGSLMQRCGCKRNPWLNYFVTGESALRRIVAGLAPEDRQRIMARFARFGGDLGGPFCELCATAQMCRAAAAPAVLEVASTKVRTRRSKRSAPRRRVRAAA